MPPVKNWPVYLNAGDVRKTGQEADNTFMEIPEILESTSRIVSRRMSDKNLQSEIKFKVREKSMIYLAVSKEAETRVIRKEGFVNTGIPGRWRNNSSQIEEYQVWSLEAEADEFIEIPDIPYEFAVFIK
jgi:hypothetical protein